VESQKGHAHIITSAFFSISLLSHFMQPNLAASEREKYFIPSDVQASALLFLSLLSSFQGYSVCLRCMSWSFPKSIFKDFLLLYKARGAPGHILVEVGGGVCVSGRSGGVLDQESCRTSL
jgi:hypothetical protein